MAIDESFIRAMHVQTLRHRGLHEGHEPGVLFQASTIGALLDGAYDGDVSFDELAGHGDLGLGTLNGLDGEMIALDGVFYRADLDGRINTVDGAEKTPFAVVVPFEAADSFEVGEPLEQSGLQALIDTRLDGADGACGLRIDGRFESVQARSVPRQHEPYRPLTDVIAGQHVFDLDAVEGTIVGFRFPDHAGGIEASGYHLHFIDSARERGGHILGFRIAEGGVSIDPSNQLRVELPPGIDLSEPHLDRPMAEALSRVEGN
jgi:acetolactate decarboxylase